MLLRRVQFRLLDILLIVGCLAAWIGFAVNRRTLHDVSARIDSLLNMAEELRDIESSEMRVITQKCVRYPDEQWVIDLPKGARYELLLATREITSERQFPTPRGRVQLAPGRHVLLLTTTRLDDQRSRIEVFVDGVLGIEVIEDADWSGSGGTSSTSDASSQETSHPLETPLVIKRMQVMERQANGSSSSVPPGVPANGLLLWVKSTP